MQARAETRTRPRKRTARKRSRTKIALPPPTDWRTTDEDEINRRRLRARDEQPRIRNLDPRHRIFSNFEIQSRSGMTYHVEIRDLAKRQFHSTTVDFQINGLGTCKHTEAVLLHLQARFPRKFAAAERHGSDRIDIVPDVAAGLLKVERNRSRLAPALRRLFDTDGYLRGATPEEAVARLRKSRSEALRISQEVDPWLRARRQAEERRLLRREYQRKVRAGRFPQHETKIPLYPYQHEGMLHLAFNERALLADEMGLGKTIQAIAACAVLHRLGKVGPRADRLAGLAQDRVGGADPEVHRPAVPGRLRSAPQASGGVRQRAVLHHRQLRADAARRARGERATRAGRRDPGRGAAHQELEHQDRPGRETPAEPLRVRPDGHPAREPHRRDLLHRQLHRPRRPGAAVPLQPRVLRSGREGASGGLPQPRQAAPAHPPLHDPPAEGRRRDRAAQPHGPQPLRPHGPEPAGCVPRPRGQRRPHPERRQAPPAHQAGAGQADAASWP